MKKIIAFFIICIFSLNITNISANENKTVLSNKIIKNNWKKYFKEIENFIEKLKTKEDVENLISKLEKIINNWKVKTDSAKIFISYTYFSAKEKLIKIKEEKNIKEILNPEVKEVNKKIINIQKELYNNYYKKIFWVYDIFGNKLDIKQNWEIKIDYNIKDIEKDINYLWILNLLDIESINYENNSKIKWKIDYRFEEKKNWETKEKLDINTDFKVIKILNDLYFLPENILINNIWKENEIRIFLEKFKKLTEEKKYIRFTNNQLKNFKNLIKNNLNLKIKNNFLYEIQSNAIFEVYKEEKQKYFLRPTKFLCDKLRFNCSEKEYKDLLKKFAKNYEASLEIKWDKIKLNLDIIENYFSLKSYIKIDNNKIKESKIKILFPKTEINSYDSVIFEYKKNFELITKIKSDLIDLDFLFKNKKFIGKIISWEKSLSLNWEVDNFGNISKFFVDINYLIPNIIWNIKFEKNNLVWNIKLKDYYFKFNINLDKDYLPKSGNIDLNIKNIKVKLNWENYIFNWKTNIKKENLDININHNINFWKYFSNINNKFIIKNFSEKIKWDLDIKLETKNNQINTNLKINTKIEEKIDFILNLKSIFYKKEINFKEKIDKPKEFIDLDEVFTDIESKYYEYYNINN